MLNEIKEEIILENQDFKTALSTELTNNSFIKPDWGFLYVEIKKKKYIILISEVKKQWTNLKRMAEWKKKRAKWNAIERLWKNLMILKTYFKWKKYFPFVCFWYGDDFSKNSTILDRIIGMNDFFPLNKIFYLKSNGDYAPASMFFREEERTTEEMFNIMYPIAFWTLKYILDYNKG